MENLKKNWSITFWIILVIGGIYLLDIFLTELAKNKWDRIQDKIDSACSVILDEQPTNESLYDRCREKGYDEFK